MYDNAMASLGRIPTLDEVAAKQYDDKCSQELVSPTGVVGRERTLAESVAFRADREQENAERCRKAARILIEHPEFEDFIWLLRSGQI
jgi:hypothetical protein